MSPEEIEKIENNTAELPDEVRDFIVGDDFKAVREKINEFIPSQEKRGELRVILLMFLLGLKTLEDLETSIDSLPVEAATKEKIKIIIVEEIINELLLLIDVHKEIDGGDSTEETDKKTDQNNALATLGDRLKQATIITPSTRDQSMARTVPAVEVKTTDQYREMPEL